MSLVLYEGDVDSTESEIKFDKESALKAHFREKKLKKALRKARKSLARTKAKIHAMLKAFDEHCGDRRVTRDELEKENIEVAAELQKLSEEEGPAPDLEPEIEKEEDDSPFCNFDEDIEDSGNLLDDSPYEQKIKRMYRKIASKWGPGRAVTQEEVDWFIAATAAYRAREMQGVQRIYNILVWGKEACEYSELTHIIAQLEEEIAGIEELKERMLGNWQEIYAFYYNRTCVGRGREFALQVAFNVNENRIELLSKLIHINRKRIKELLAQRRAREKGVEDDDPFADVPPSLGFWKFS